MEPVWNKLENCDNLETGEVFIGRHTKHYIDNRLCLFMWDERSNCFNFKHRNVAWWEKSPLSMSINEWRRTRYPVDFGHPSILWDGKDIDKL